MSYTREEIDGGWRYYWDATDEARDWLRGSGIPFEDYPGNGGLVHEVFDPRIEVLIKTAWHGR